MKDVEVRSIRKTDQVGRVVIPREIRTRMGIETSDSMILDLVKDEENDEYMCIVRKEGS